MKKTYLWLALALAGTFSAAWGQSLAGSNGYTVQPLFSVTGGSFNLGLSSLGAGNGSIYYLETNNFGSGVETHLRSYSIAGTSSSDLYDYNTAVSGGFVKTLGSTVYFSATSDFTSYSVLSYNTGTATNGVVSNAIAGIYDLAFSGSTAYLSANPSGSNNQVYRLNLSTGAITSVMSTGGDYSGPIMFDGAGNLYYGVTSLFSNGDLYRYTAAQVDTAFNTNTPLTLGSGVDLYNLNGSQYLALGDNGQFFQSISPFGSAGTLSLLSTAGGALKTIGTTGPADFISGIAYSSSKLYVAVTDGGSYNTTVYALVPEPAAVLLLTASVGFLLLQRPRRGVA